MKITVTTETGTEGNNCWQCMHGPASGPMCELFGKRRTKSEQGAAWSRLPECLDAEKNTRRQDEQDNHEPDGQGR